MSRRTCVFVPVVFASTLAGCRHDAGGQHTRQAAPGPRPGTDTAGEIDTARDTDTLTTAWGSVLVRVSAGSFVMGGGSGDPAGRYRDHEVTLTHDAWVGTTELTRSQWERSPANVGWVYRSLPAFPCTTSTTDGDCPVDSVTWFDAARYCNALSALEGLPECYVDNGEGSLDAPVDPYSCSGYRLPTEAEWELAARAGLDTAYAGSDVSTEVAWTAENAMDAGTFVHEVAALAPNALGLYDMSGNTWEWTNDWYEAEFGGYGSGEPSTDPSGPASGAVKAVRGGVWTDAATEATVSERVFDFPERSFGSWAFRLARTLR